MASWQRASLPSHFSPFLTLPLPFFQFQTNIFCCCCSATRHLSMAKPLLCAVWVFRASPPWSLHIIVHTVSCAVAFTAEGWLWFTGSFRLHHLLGILEKFMWEGCREISVMLLEWVSLIWPDSPHSEHRTALFPWAALWLLAAQHQLQSRQNAAHCWALLHPLWACSLDCPPHSEQYRLGVRTHGYLQHLLLTCVSF